MDTIPLEVWLPREIRLFGYGHIFASGHRHGARYQSRDARDQDIVPRRGRRSNADNQACGRNYPIVGSEHRCSQPPNAVHEVVLWMPAKTTTRMIPDQNWPVSSVCV